MNEKLIILLLFQIRDHKFMARLLEYPCAQRKREGIKGIMCHFS